MSGFLNIDWKDFSTFGSPVGEIVLRAAVVYLALFFLLRFGRKHTAGAVGLSDLLVVVVIADAVQNAMASEHKTVLDGWLLAAATILILELDSGTWRSTGWTFASHVCNGCYVPLLCPWCATANCCAAICARSW